MKIKKAKSEDIEKISYLIQNTLKKVNYKDYPRKVLEELLRKNTPKNLKEEFKKSKAFIIVEKKRILGVVAIEKNKIGKFFVKHTHIGKGIVKKLLKFIECYAKKQGLKTLKLYPTKTALEIYKKWGYKIKKHQIWKIKGYKIRVPVMEKRLR